MDPLKELLQQIMDLAGAGIDAIDQATGGGGEQPPAGPPEEGAPPEAAA